MLRKIVNKVFFILVLVSVGSIYFYLFSQDKKDDLFEKKKIVQQEIEYTNKLLKATTKKRGKTVQNIRLIEQKIKKRQKLISLYQREIIEINSTIDLKEKRIDALSAELDKQKKYYADFIYYAYKNKSDYTVAVYLLASNTLNQFYMRKKYMDQLKEARSEKINLIKVLKREIDKEINTLLKEKSSKESTVKTLKEERILLSHERASRESHVKELINDENLLKKQIRDKKRIAAEIASKIEELIREEAKKDKYSKLTPEQLLISDNFERNKGRLPWPTRQGVITEGFGKHMHPVIPGVQTFNSGIDITTAKDEYVRSIFSGTVSRIFSVKNSNYSIIIRHGSYYSVYNNLVNIKVKVGDNVKTKDIIGSVAYNSIDDCYSLELLIYKGYDKLNPEQWLSH